MQGESGWTRLPSDDSSRLTVKDFGRQDVGRYACSAANGVGSDLRTEFELGIWSTSLAS